jgi:hypothetical protein
MSEKLFRFLLSELTIIRVCCLNPVCKGVIEIPLDKLRTMFPKCCCPLCRQQFHQPYDDGSHLLEWLGKAIEELKAIKDKVEIEFSLPDKT